MILSHNNILIKQTLRDRSPQQSFVARILVAAATRHKKYYAVWKSQSTSSTNTTTLRHFSVGADDEEPEILLFRRGDHKITLARSAFFVSTFHTLYWFWYTVDFVPAINNSPTTELHIDPMLPMVGLFTASVIQAGTVLYPKRLLSKVTWRPKAEQLILYNYTLPFIHPHKEGRIFPLGQVILDASSAEAKKLVFQCESNLSLFRGHLPISKENSWPPYLLDIQQPENVPQPEILLEALMQPESMTKPLKPAREEIHESVPHTFSYHKKHSKPKRRGKRQRGR